MSTLLDCGGLAAKPPPSLLVTAPQWNRGENLKGRRKKNSWLKLKAVGKVKQSYMHKQSKIRN